MDADPIGDLSLTLDIRKDDRDPQELGSELLSLRSNANEAITFSRLYDLMYVEEPFIGKRHAIRHLTTITSNL